MRRAGFTIIEVLVAIVLLGMALAGLVALFAFTYSMTRHSQDVGIAYNIGRQEIERARTIGFKYLPEWEWSAGYDGLGNQTAEPEPHFVSMTTVATIPDENGELNMTCLRTVHVEVRAREGDELLFATTTYLTRGGI